MVFDGNSQEATAYQPKTTCRPFTTSGPALSITSHHITSPDIFDATPVKASCQSFTRQTDVPGHLLKKITQTHPQTKRMTRLRLSRQRTTRARMPSGVQRTNNKFTTIFSKKQRDDRIGSWRKGRTQQQKQQQRDCQQPTHDKQQEWNDLGASFHKNKTTHTNTYIGASAPRVRWMPHHSKLNQIRAHMRGSLSLIAI